MSYSRFMIIVGSGNPYHGGGMKPAAMLTFFDDKGAWVFNGLLSESPRLRCWYTRPGHEIDDAMLMISLFELRTDLHGLQQAARQHFRCDPFADEHSHIRIGDPTAIPANAACMRDLPSSRWRNEFSKTTIESSMIIPTEMLSASIDMTLSVKPIALTKVSVAMMVVGMVTAATRAPRGLRRNTRMTSTARKPPRSSSPWVS